MFVWFYFFLAYTRSTIFYLFHDDVIRRSAINLHLAFYLRFAHHHRCPFSTVCGRYSGKIQTILLLIVCLPSALAPSSPLSRHSHLPRQHQWQLAISVTASSQVSNNQMKPPCPCFSLAGWHCRPPTKLVLKLAAVALAAISSVDWSVT